MMLTTTTRKTITTKHKITTKLPQTGNAQSILRKGRRPVDDHVRYFRVLCPLRVHCGHIPPRKGQKDVESVCNAAVSPRASKSIQSYKPGEEYYDFLHQPCLLLPEA